MGGTRQYIGARYVPAFADPIGWDDQRSFEALTIVNYLGASYTSKKPVPAGVLPTNAEYWALTGNYNAQVEEYRQETESLNTLYNGINSTVQKIETLGMRSGATDTFRYHINAETGDDTNDGLTANTAFKTLTHFLDLCKYGSRTNRAYIDAPGSYDIDKPIITLGSECHITGQVDGVIIRNTCGARIAFYTSHFNFNNLTFTSADENGFYFDGSFCTLIKCNFNHGVSFNGCTVEMESCKFPNVAFNVSIAQMRLLTIAGSSPLNNAISIATSHVGIFGTLSVATLPESSDFAILKADRSFVALQSGLSGEQRGWKNGIKCTASTILISQSRYTGWGGCSTEGNALDDDCILPAGVTK